MLLNTPFFILGYTLLGKRFFVLSFYAILVLTVITSQLEPFPVITAPYSYSVSRKPSAPWPPSM
ncbi:YitT family protein [Neobacillus muris]|uniref:YitT family protein n=1 Tax=Neobacillus muris TaxID=2941334 RepID=UPI00203F2843|nr:YitT family protein [Neobacillus muris]